MEQQSIKNRAPQWVRFTYLDLRNLLANPIAFTLPTVLILIINLIYLNAVITSHDPYEHLLPIATFFLLTALLSSLLSIPFEIREGYADRIQSEFGSIGRRVIVRITSNALIGLVLVLLPYLVLTLQNRFQRLTLDFQFEKFLLLTLASLYVTTLGTLVGAMWRNYVALSLLGAAILILQVAHGFSEHSGWAFSSLVEKQLLLVQEVHLWSAYLMGIFLFIQVGIIVTSPLGNWLNRSRRPIKSELITTINESRFGGNLLGFPSGVRFPLVLKEIASVSAHMKLIPFSLFLFAVYPIVSAEGVFTDLSPQLKVPIVASMLITSLFSCALSIGGYRLSQDEQERDALAFGGTKRYRRFTDLTYCGLFTILGIVIFLGYMATEPALRSEILSTLSIKPLVLILVAVPLFIALARKIINLKIDVRFFILFSIVIPIGEMIISGIAPQLSVYLPSSILASLAGGKGLYVLMYT